MDIQNPESEGLRESEETGEDYEPFGDEWRKEVMKLTKAQIIELLRDVCLKQQTGL